MTDKLLREGLIESDRFLELPNDTCRLAYIPLLIKADDFGNLESGIKKLFRLWEPLTQLKTLESATICLSHLMDADLVRGYTSNGREFLHLPRFKSHRSYLVRKCPPSPWCNPEITLGKHIRKVTDQDHAKNLPVTLPQHTSNLLLGVGVGVGVGVNQKRTSTAAAGDNSKVQTWSEHWQAQGKALGIETKHGEKTGDYCRRVQAFAKTRAAKPKVGD